MISAIAFTLAGVQAGSILAALLTGEWRWLLVSIGCYLLIRRM